MNRETKRREEGDLKKVHIFITPATHKKKATVGCTTERKEEGGKAKSQSALCNHHYHLQGEERVRDMRRREQKHKC